MTNPIGLALQSLIQEWSKTRAKSNVDKQHMFVKACEGGDQALLSTRKRSEHPHKQESNTKK